MGWLFLSSNAMQLHTELKSSEMWENRIKNHKKNGGPETTEQSLANPWSGSYWLTVSVIHIITICSTAVKHQGHISCTSPARVSADSSLKGSVESFGRVPVKPRYMNPNSHIVSFCSKLLLELVFPGLTTQCSTVGTTGVFFFSSVIFCKTFVCDGIIMALNYVLKQMKIKIQKQSSHYSWYKALFPVTVTQVLFCLVVVHWFPEPLNGSVYISPVHDKQIEQAAVQTQPSVQQHIITSVGQNTQRSFSVNHLQ